MAGNQAIAGIFAGFADAFVGRVRAGNDIALPERLDRAALDLSSASLAAVDAYLEAVHQSAKPTGLLGRITARGRGFRVTPELETTILWGGAMLARYSAVYSPRGTGSTTTTTLPRCPRARRCSVRGT